MKFRTLKAGEILREGDQCVCEASPRGWFETAQAGFPADPDLTYRRPIKPSKQSKNSKPAARRKAAK